MSAQSWQNTCPRCGWANSGAEKRCLKCGQALRTSPGLLVAGQSASSAIAPSAQAKMRRVVQPGGFFPRLIAFIVDVLILSVVAVPVALLVLSQAPLAPGGQSTPFLDLIGLGSQLSAERQAQLLQLSLGLAVLQLFYYVGTWSILGGSPGQLVMSLRVVDPSAKTIGFGRAVFRYFMKGFFGILSPVSALMVAFGKDKRAIHDLLAGTFVIQFLDPKLEDFDSILAPVQAAASTPVATPPPVTSQVPQETYSGAALAAAAVSGPAPAAPEPQVAPAALPTIVAPAPSVNGAPAAPLSAIPPAPATAAPPAPAAPVSPAAPYIPAAPAPPPGPVAPDQSAFERYAPPTEAPPLPPPTAPEPTEPPPSPPPTAPELPVFPTSDRGGYQPMAPAPAPPGPPAEPGSEPPLYQPPTQPAEPFVPRVPPTPDAPPPTDAES
jgi:uncharacterized RDD family membrane protein YckC